MKYSIEYKVLEINHDTKNIDINISEYLIIVIYNFFGIIFSFFPYISDKMFIIYTCKKNVNVKIISPKSINFIIYKILIINILRVLF